MITKNKLRLAIAVLSAILMYGVYIYYTSYGWRAAFGFIGFMITSTFLGIFIVGHTFPELYNNEGI